MSSSYSRVNPTSFNLILLGGVASFVRSYLFPSINYIEFKAIASLIVPPSRGTLWSTFYCSPAYFVIISCYYSKSDFNLSISFWYSSYFLSFSTYYYANCMLILCASGFSFNSFKSSFSLDILISSLFITFLFALLFN